MGPLVAAFLAMVFVERPYYNEPGYEYRPNKEQEEAYNRAIEPHTINHALLNYLPPNAMDPLWADVIQAHFEQKGEKILQTVNQWGSLPNSQVTAKLRKQLEDALKTRKIFN